MSAVIQLSVADKHHWAPVPQVVQFLCDRLPAAAKVLEIGPGTAPFVRADTVVDFVDLPDRPGVRSLQCDVSRERLPFPDKSFDFVVCRHMLEDMFDPFPVCEEMSRVAHAGYIETPSPIAELARGVDGGAPAYRGYHHHRFMAWVHGGELRFVSKYPLVEYLGFDEQALVTLLRAGPRYWNTYYLWSDRITVKHRQSPLDFDIPRDYQMLLCDAIKQSRAASDEFWQPIPDRVEISNLGLQRTSSNAA